MPATRVEAGGGAPTGQIGQADARSATDVDSFTPHSGVRAIHAPDAWSEPGSRDFAPRIADPLRVLGELTGLEKASDQLLHRHDVDMARCKPSVVEVRRSVSLA